MKALRAALCLLLAAALLTALPAAASAEEGAPFAMTVSVGENQMPVRALQDAYAGNIYLSLRDLSAALSGSEEQFHYAYSYSNEDGYSFHITTGREADNDSGGSGDVAWLDSWNATNPPLAARVRWLGREIVFSVMASGAAHGTAQDASPDEKEVPAQ